MNSNSNNNAKETAEGIPITINDENKVFFDYFINYKLNDIFHGNKIPTIEESMRIYNYIYLSNSTPTSNDKAFKIKGLRIYNKIYSSLSKITIGINETIFTEKDSNRNKLGENNFNFFFILFKKCKKFTEYLASTFSYIDRFFVNFNKKSPEDFLWMKFLNLFYKNCLRNYENEISISFFNELKIFRKSTNNKTKITSLNNEIEGGSGIMNKNEILSEKENNYRGEPFNNEDEIRLNSNSQRYQNFSFFSKFYKNLLKHCNALQGIDQISNEYLNGLDLYFAEIFEDKLNSKKNNPNRSIPKFYGSKGTDIKSSKEFPAHCLLKAVTLELKFSKLAFDDKYQYLISLKLKPYKEYIEDYLTYCLKNFKSFKYSIIVIQYMNKSNIEDFKKIYKNHVNSYLTQTGSEDSLVCPYDNDEDEKIYKKFKKDNENNIADSIFIGGENEYSKVEKIHKSYRKLYNQIVSNSSQYLCYSILESEIKGLVKKLNFKETEYFIDLIGKNMNKSIINNSKRISNFKIRNSKIPLNNNEVKLHNELVRKIDYYLFNLYKIFYNFNLKGDYLKQTQRRLLLNVSDIDVELKYEKEISLRVEKHSILARTLNSFREGHAHQTKVNYGSKYKPTKETPTSNNLKKTFLFKLFKLVDYFWVNFNIYQDENSENFFQKIVNLFNFDISEEIKLLRNSNDSKIQYFIKNDFSQVKFKILNCRIISNNFDFLIISLIAKGKERFSNDVQINMKQNPSCEDSHFTPCDIKYLMSYTDLSKKFIIDRIKLLLKNEIVKPVLNTPNVDLITKESISDHSLFEIDSENLINKSKSSKKTFTINIYYLMNGYLENITGKNCDGDSLEKSNNLINETIINKGRIMRFMKRSKRANLRDINNIFADIKELDEIIEGLVDNKYLEYSTVGLDLPNSDKFIDYVL